MSGATNDEVGAPETRITVPMELVLTPRDDCLNPGTWTRGHRSKQAYSSECWRQPLGSGWATRAAQLKNSEVNSLRITEKMSSI